ncbi:MAG: hypothetical protein N2V78_09145 [Methanophagales archaeon]|nr:hypothetical protein [Methanophagales archaeon]
MKDITYFQWLISLPGRFIRGILRLNRNNAEYFLGLFIIVGTTIVCKHTESFAMWVIGMVLGVLLMTHGIYLDEKKGSV